MALVKLALLKLALLKLALLKLALSHGRAGIPVGNQHELQLWFGSGGKHANAALSALFASALAALAP